MRRSVGPRIYNRLPDIVLSVAALTLSVVVVPMAKAYVTAGSQERQCIANLRAIWEATERYRDEHGGKYPRALVAITPAHARQEEKLLLAPRWLASDQLVCPADPNPNRRRWTLPCSYWYQLQALMFPETRELVESKLIDPYGSRLRLVVCTARHHVGSEVLSLRADGTVTRESIHAFASDPQMQLRHSFIELRQAAVRKANPGQQHPLKTRLTGEKTSDR